MKSLWDFNLEEDEAFKNAIDLLFDDLAHDKPDHFAVRQYAKFKLAAGKTAKSILISCGARLAPFDIAELRDLLAYDEMELDMIGDQRTALFIIVSDTDSTFNFVVAMMYSQLFNLLCDRADDVHGGRLPYHVRFLLDEFANIGQIPMFDKLIATIRSREMSANIIRNQGNFALGKVVRAEGADAPRRIKDSAGGTFVPAQDHLQGRG